MPNQQWEYMVIEWDIAPQVWNVTWGTGTHAARGRVRHEGHRHLT